MANSSQKFIARNRAPRVQIEYDVELYGAEKKVQLPFVMGVMSDLAGKSKVAQPAVADRKFLEIDVDNFDDRMKAVAPRAAFSFFRFCFETFAIEANSNSHFRPIFRNQRHGHEFEQHFELEQLFLV